MSDHDESIKRSLDDLETAVVRLTCNAAALLDHLHNFSQYDIAEWDELPKRLNAAHVNIGDAFEYFEQLIAIAKIEVHQ